ncbi:MAG: AI-2E family transporter, partial [Polyangiales bacterium]
MGARALIGMAAFVVVCAGLHAAASVLVPVLLAIFVATVTAPLVLALTDRRVPLWLAVLAALVVDVAALAVLGLLVFVSLNTFVERLPEYQDRLFLLIDELTQLAQAYGLDISARQLDKLLGADRLFTLVGRTLPGIVGFMRGLAGIIVSALLVLLLLIFMLLETPGFRSKLLHLSHGASVLSPSNVHATREVQKYLSIKTGTSLVTGLLVGLWVAMLEVDLPLLWGVLAFALNYVPTLGSIIAAVPPIIVALLTQNVGTALAVTVGYLTVNGLIGNLIEPRLLGRALGLSPLVVLLSML